MVTGKQMSTRLMTSAIITDRFCPDSMIPQNLDNGLKLADLKLTAIMRPGVLTRVAHRN
jgi:hypothetical protein